MPDHTLGAIAASVGGVLHGAPEPRIRGIASLEAAGPDQISFFQGSAAHRETARTSRAAALLVGRVEELPQAQIVVRDVRRALAGIAALFHLGRRHEPAGVHTQAVIGPDSQVGEGAGVGPFTRIGSQVRIGRRTSIAERCSIGDGCTVGDDVVLHPGVTIYPGCTVGDRVEIHSGAVIGVDGYSIALGEGVPVKIPSLGTVVVADDVEIFANVTIARAALDQTVIGRHTKLDCLCHVAHNCQLGQGVIIAAFGGLSGSVKVGDGAILAGGIGAVDHISIGKGARIGAGSGLERDVAAGEEVWGHPAKPAKLEMRLQAILRKLPEIWRPLMRLVKREEQAGSGAGPVEGPKA